MLSIALLFLGFNIAFAAEHGFLIQVSFVPWTVLCLAISSSEFLSVPQKMSPHSRFVLTAGGPKYTAAHGRRFKSSGGVITAWLL